MQHVWSGPDRVGRGIPMPQPMASQVSHSIGWKSKAPSMMSGAGYQVIFDDLPFTVDDNGVATVVSVSEEFDAKRLLERFVFRMYRRGQADAEEVKALMSIYHRARELDVSFTDAVIAAMATALCSADFLFLDSNKGLLDKNALASRLAFFLWNGPPDEALRADPDGGQVDRMLNDKRSHRFVDAFLDYWLDLRDLNANAPDAELYPDYYLDDWLTESSLLETRMFFRELIDKNLPARNLVDADFVFANERLAQHYELPAMEGAQLRRVKLPKGSVRGGLLTQASVLRVTANGTTTSPVVRGAWVMERIMGLEIPPPPSGVEAITPDTRGATTIREQLDLHRAAKSCAACHIKFDPAGFALESFDVTGGWRDNYRAVGDIGETVGGFGKNGHAFLYRLAQEIDPSATLPDGNQFRGIQEFKALLLKDERTIARNLVKRLVTYATGATISFADRAKVEHILDQALEDEYGVRTLIHGVVTSEMFLKK
ncbi:MAG TPA: DUF1588 domain-containing protein [Verrucomicrobiales bacterium]|nr:DUF1588 domain-containing protein [Verrucomicrobiales bacterium]